MLNKAFIVLEILEATPRAWIGCRILGRRLNFEQFLCSQLFSTISRSSDPKCQQSNKKVRFPSAHIEIQTTSQLSVKLHPDTSDCNQPL